METVALTSPASASLVWQEHPDFALAFKPPGMSFHTEGEQPGVVAWLKGQPGGASLHVVHRLDRMTSGLLLCARNAEVAAEFGRMFEAGQVGKYYLALSDRRPAKKQGCIKGAMQRGRGGNWRLTREGELRAVTQFFSFLAAPGLRLFVVHPRTGRTHQIRVALRSLGAPILGDDRYGGSPADRGYLHANALCFTWKGEDFRFFLPPVEGMLFQQYADQLPEAPWELEWPV